MRKSPQNFSEFALESGLAGALNHVCKTVLVYRLAKFTDIFLKKSTYKKKNVYLLRFGYIELPPITEMTKEINNKGT